MQVYEQDYKNLSINQAKYKKLNKAKSNRLQQTKTNQLTSVAKTQMETLIFLCIQTSSILRKI